MKLFKFPEVASDALTGGLLHVDVTSLTNIATTGATMVMEGSNWVLTWTFDGTNAAEKLVNANKAKDYILPLITPYLGDKMNRKEFNTVYSIFEGLTIAQIHTELSDIVHTGGSANTALVSIVLS